MSTKQQLDADFLLSLRETSDDTHFTSSQRTGFLNQALNFIAALSNSTSDLVKITTENNVGAYTVPSDNLLFQEAYFGDETAVENVYPLEIITRKFLKEIDPGWLDETSGKSGKPRYLVKLDRQTLYIHPRPDTEWAGKKVLLYYGYLPAALSADGDTPDLPTIYHPLITLYALYLAYDSLTNPEMSAKKFNDFKGQYNMLKDVVDREADETFNWKWMALE